LLNITSLYHNARYKKHKAILEFSKWCDSTVPLRGVMEKNKQWKLQLVFYTLSILSSGKVISLHLQTERRESMNGPESDNSSVKRVDIPFHLKIGNFLFSVTWFLAWDHGRYKQNQSPLSNAQSSEYFEAAFDMYEAFHWRAHLLRNSKLGSPDVETVSSDAREINKLWLWRFQFAYYRKLKLMWNWVKILQ